MYTQQQYQSVLSQQKSTIQKVLDDNSQLILLILDLQYKGKQNECLEHQRILHRNLNYLIQFDPSTVHHPNNLPPPDAFIQTQPSMINGNMIQQTQSDQIYRTQTNSPASSNILNQAPQNTSTNPYPSSTSNSINKPTISQQRSPYLQQGRVLNSNSMDSSYNPQQSYSIQQNDYGQYPIHHQQQQNSSTNTQNLVSNQHMSYNNYNEQQVYYPQQNYLMQHQWQNQPRMSTQQHTSYQQQTPPQI